MHQQNLPLPSLILFNRDVDDFIVRLEFEEKANVDELINSDFHIPESSISDKHEVIVRRISSRYSDPYQLLKTHQVKLTGLDFINVDVKKLLEFLETKHLDKVVEINSSIDRD